MFLFLFDLSNAVMERTLFHSDNSYYIPNLIFCGTVCKTNLPPNTAFRGFGGPQGMFVIEAALAHAAKEIGIPAFELQKKNLLIDGDEFPYGQIADQVGLSQIWSDMETKFDIQSTKKRIEEFNNTNSSFKKGMSLMPISFGISPDTWIMQAFGEDMREQFNTAIVDNAYRLCNLFHDEHWVTEHNVKNEIGYLLLNGNLVYLEVYL